MRSSLFEWFKAEPAMCHLLQERTFNNGTLAIELMPDERGHQRPPRNDDEPVDRAVVLKEIQSAPVHFLSYDTGAVLPANLAGLTGLRLKDDPPPSATGGGS